MGGYPKRFDNSPFHQYIFGARDYPKKCYFRTSKSAREHQSFFQEAAFAMIQKFFMNDYLELLKHTEEDLKFKKT